MSKQTGETYTGDCLHLASAIYLDESRSSRDNDRDEGNRGLETVVIRIVMALFDRGSCRFGAVRWEPRSRTKSTRSPVDFFSLPPSLDLALDLGLDLFEIEHV